MALSEPTAGRELLHSRDIALRGFRRADGLFDIEARLTDTKSYGFGTESRGWIEPGENLHGMWARITVDFESRHRLRRGFDRAGPFDICPGGAQSFARLAGLTIKPGFLRAANERLGGTQGCTHLRELLQQLATVAFQTSYSVRTDLEKASGDGPSPRLVNTCHAYASDQAVVKRRWPHLYTGPAENEAVAALAGAEPAD